MLEDKNTYITETGALMSAHDYSFLSADQKERCKVYKMEHAKEDKPDFDKMAEDVYPQYFGDRFFPNNAEDNQAKLNQQVAYKNGCEKIWNDYVIPEREESCAKIAQLETVVKALKSAMIRGTNLHDTLLFDDQEIPLTETLRKENDRLKSELDKPKQELENL